MAANNIAAGQKRPDQNDFDPMTSPINLGPVAPYDPKTEQAPSSVSQSKEWLTYKACEETVKELLTQPTENLECKDKSLQGLVNVVNTRVGGRKPQKIILCLTGPMGTGKSATLNSLFSVGRIAREGDLGGSCTLTSCTYQARKTDQEEPFLAEVNFFDRQQRRDILSSYLSAYYHANRGNDEDGESESLEDAEANLDIRNEVINTVNILFGEQKVCRTKQDVRNFLDEATSPNDDQMLSKLCRWCDKVITQATNGRAVISISASTAGELSNKLEDFTAYAEDDNGNVTVCLTPMVSLISFHFDDPLTRLGITFLDTPGTSDYNRTRKKSANEHRKIRTHSAILSDESRVKDESGITKEVKNMQNRGPGRTLIVITKSDIMQDTAMPSGSRKDKERCRQLKKSIERVEKELSALEFMEVDAEKKEDHERSCILVREKQVLEMRVILLQNQEKAHRISMRSESNKKVLEEKLLDATDSLVPILSISNKQYARHLDGYRAKHAPVLSVEQTNIPALRRLIATFPNEARLNEIKHQQEVNLPALLNRIRLYTVQSASDRKEDMECHLISPIKRCRARMEGSFESFNSEVSNLLKAIREDEQEWTTTAGELCDKWASEFKTGVFMNLLKRDGRRKGTIRGRELNLSGELIRISSVGMGGHFRKIRPALQTFGEYLAEDVGGLVEEMIERLQADENESFMSLGPFYNYIAKEKARMQGQVKAACEVLLNGIDDIRRRAVSEDEDAYLIEAMLPIYAQVRILKGGKDQKHHLAKPPKIGWPAHRKVVFKNEVTKLNGVWTFVYSNLESEFKILFEKECEDLIVEIQKIFGEIHSAFDEMCEVQDTTDPEQIKAREQLKINIEEAQQILDGPMHQAYEALERDFRRVEVSSLHID